MLLKNQWFNDEIKGEIRNYFETNENGNTTFQNLWATAKTVLTGKFVAIQAFLKKKEKAQIYGPNLPPKGINKRRDNKVQSQQKEEIIKIREEINKIENKKQ